MKRRGALTPALAALALLLALIQRPGTATTDTKIDLHVDPVRFLGQVASAWSSTGDLGHVQGGQYGGYLFPMGPFFALGRAIGLSPWLVHRLWLGLVLLLALLGFVRLMVALAAPLRLTVKVSFGSLTGSPMTCTVICCVSCPGAIVSVPLAMLW